MVLKRCLTSTIEAWQKGVTVNQDRNADEAQTGERDMNPAKLYIRRNARSRPD